MLSHAFKRKLCNVSADFGTSTDCNASCNSFNWGNILFSISFFKSVLVWLLPNVPKFNAAFRRHTSLNILHTLEDDGRIYNAKGAYVDFLWNKFRVTADGGLRREYRYTDDLFIDALVKAHADVASDSQRVIGIMIDTETELHKKNKDSEAS